MTASPRALALAALLVALPLAAGCANSTNSRAAQQAMDGTDLKWTLKSYHVIESVHNGPVGYLKVFDVQQAGGPIYTWKYVYDRDFNELGWVNQLGQAFRREKYPPGAMPDPKEPYRTHTMPADSIERNAMRMLGIDPAIDDVTFPVAKDGDIR